MSLRVAIQNCLLAATEVTAIIGAGDAMKHYPSYAKEGIAPPYVVSFEIASNPHTTHGVPGDREDTMDETIMQFSCYGDSMLAAAELRQKVREAMLDDAGGVFAAAHIVVTAPDTREFHEPDVKYFCAQLDLTFFHNPST